MTPPRPFHVELADGQAFDVELAATREAVEWFLLLDWPKAVFEWDLGRVTAWESAAAKVRGDAPVATVAPAPAGSP